MWQELDVATTFEHHKEKKSGQMSEATIFNVFFFILICCCFNADIQTLKKKKKGSLVTALVPNLVMLPNQIYNVIWTQISWNGLQPYLEAETAGDRLI